MAIPALDAKAICSAYIVSSYVAHLLLTVETLLFIKCMFRKQCPFTRTLAIMLMISDIVKHSCLLVDVFTSCGDSPLRRISPALPVAVIATALAGFCEHFYLITRFHFMSKNLRVTTVLGILTIAQFMVQLAGAGYMVKYIQLPPPLSISAPLTTAGWGVGTTLDILIAIALVWQLLRFNAFFASTKSIIRKFLVSAVVSGVLTAIYGVLLLIFCYTVSAAHTILAYNFGKIYAITVFANLALVQRMQMHSSVVLWDTNDIAWGSTRASTKPPASTAIPVTETIDNRS